MKLLKRQTKNVLLCGLLLVMSMVLMTGCGSDAAGDSADAQESLNLQALCEDMIAADTTLPEMVTVTDADDQAELNFGSFSDFDYDRVASYIYAYAKDGGVQEVVIVELKDAGDAAALMNTMQDHLTDRRGTLEAYAPDQVTLVDHAVIKQKGRYVTMIISPKSGLMQQVFDAA